MLLMQVMDIKKKRLLRQTQRCSLRLFFHKKREMLEYVVTRLQVTRCYASLSFQSIKHELLYRTAILDVPNLEVV